jgi:hypothetical protein
MESNDLKNILLASRLHIEGSVPVPILSSPILLRSITTGSIQARSSKASLSWQIGPKDAPRRGYNTVNPARDGRVKGMEHGPSCGGSLVPG